MNKNRFAVLAPGFEHLSYPLDRHDAAEGAAFSERSERFSLSRAQSEPHAQMALVSSEGLSEHASEPVGYVCAEDGGIFVVCRSEGRKGGEIAQDERASFSLAVMKRLASLHTQGFGCGGLTPDAVEFAGKEAKLISPSVIFALHEGETTYYEAVSTLRALVSSGVASEADLPRLASVYLSHSPVCRHEIVQHLQSKGKKGTARDGLVESAMRIIPYF
ncbi:MAG: hypothetical protein NTX79_00650 [Candidatus Micrarchaeota archaeon]|nr:hypothetical protein [Candidatus Micrarchaeota archaeon]